MAKKRGNNEGSVFQRQDGRFSASYYANGKRKYLYAATREEAARKLRAVQTQVDGGRYIEPSALTVERWLLTWLHEYAATSLRVSTVNLHESITRTHLIPALGAYRLQALRPEHVQAFVNAQVRAGYAPGTVKRQVATLKVALHQAVRNQLIPLSPADHVGLPKQEQKTIEFLTAEEVAALLPVLPDSTPGRAIRFILGSGLRVSELCGLRWCDVGPDAFSVNQVTYLASQNGEAVRIVTAPKTNAGRRTIPLNSLLSALLAAQRQAQRLDRVHAGTAWQGGDPGRGEQYVFASLLGTPLDRNNLARSLRLCLAKAGLKTRGVHALRHTFATLWVQSGADLRTLSEILGHTSVAFTMQRYVHSDLATKRRGMDVMGTLT